ncbi:MAG: hypothetical protein QM755_16345 [Luteolibacter sp.]
MSADHSLWFKTSGVDQGVVHWSSQESFVKADDIYQSMLWIFENRRILPSLVRRDQIIASLAQEPPLDLLSDGIHVVAPEALTDGWTEALDLPVTVHAANDVPPSLKLLMHLTGANCFLFQQGSCEAEIAVGEEATDEQITAGQALSFLKSMAPPPAPHDRDQPPRVNIP